MVLGLAPGLEPLLRSELHWTAGEAGALFMTELGAMALASWAFEAARTRWPARRVLLFATAAWTAAQLLAALWLRQRGALLATRALSGLAAGALMLGVLEYAAARGTVRTLSHVVLAQIVSGAVLLAALPGVHALGGLQAVFAAMAALGLPALLAPARLAPAGPADRAAGIVPGRWLAGWRVGAAALVFNVAGGALWTYQTEFVPAALLTRPATAQAVGQIVAWASLAGVAGALAAARAARHGGLRGWTLAGMAGMAAAAALLARCGGLAGFAAACVLASVALNFTVPFLLAHGAPAADRPSTMAAVNAGFAAGLALGPALGGAVLDNAGPGLLAGAVTALFAVAGLLLPAPAAGAGRAAPPNVE